MTRIRQEVEVQLTSTLHQRLAWLIAALTLALGGCLDTVENPPEDPDPDSPPADVTFRLPADGASLIASVLLSASAPDLDRVEFLLDGQVVHVAEEAPFEYEFDPATVDEGEHELSVASFQGDLEERRTVRVRVARVAPPEEPPPPGEYPVNTWVQVEPEVIFPEQYPGYEGRPTWGSFVYAPDEAKVLFYGGYRDTNVDGERKYSIFDNAIYAWDVTRNTRSLLAVTAWLGGTQHIWEIDGMEGLTPANRHVYRGIAYVPSTRELHMAGGANTRTEGIDLKEGWAFSLDTKTWRKTGRLDDSSMYEGNMLYVPPLKKLFFFANRKIWEYDVVEDDAWKLIDDDTGAHRFWKAASIYDPKRQRIVFRDDEHNDDNDRGLVIYDPLENRLEVLQSSGPGGRGMMTYISKYDVYFVLERYSTGAYVFDPNREEWTSLSLGGSISTPDYTDTYDYLVYDEHNDVLAVLRDKDWFVLRYEP